jgi:hypothetical protein
MTTKLATGTPVTLRVLENCAEIGMIVGETSFSTSVECVGINEWIRTASLKYEEQHGDAIDKMEDAGDYYEHIREWTLSQMAADRMGAPNF